MPELLMSVTGFGSATIAVAAVRRFAIANSILDIPNARSSHSSPVPRGGGLGVVVPFVCLVLLFLGLSRTAELSVGYAMLGMLLLVAVGWMDDRSGVRVRVRLAAHIVAAAAVVPLVALLPVTPGLLVGLSLLTMFGAVSAINIVNFMDGIDGLIGSQLLLFGVHAAMWSPADSPARVWGVLLASTCAGFLMWNWPRARVFLGDAGSGALGFAVVVGGILLLRTSDLNVFGVFLPMFPLVLDASTTLFRRLREREQVWRAHRTHLYQRLANGGWGHRRVTLAYAAAAACGAAVVGVDRIATWPLLTLGYCVAVLVVGMRLHAAFPVADARLQDLESVT